MTKRNQTCQKGSAIKYNFPSKSLPLFCTRSCCQIRLLAKSIFLAEKKGTDHKNLRKFILYHVHTHVENFNHVSSRRRIDPSKDPSALTSYAVFPINQQLLFCIFCTEEAIDFASFRTKLNHEESSAVDGKFFLFSPSLALTSERNSFKFDAGLVASKAAGIALASSPLIFVARDCSSAKTRERRCSTCPSKPFLLHS